MLYGGSSWSEKALGSLIIQVPNGDEFDFSSIIDIELGLSGVIGQVLSNNNKIDTTFSFDGNLDTVNQFTLTIDKSSSETLI